MKLNALSYLFFFINKMVEVFVLLSFSFLSRGSLHSKRSRMCPTESGHVRMRGTRSVRSARKWHESNSGSAKNGERTKKVAPLFARPDVVRLLWERYLRSRVHRAGDNEASILLAVHRYYELQLKKKIILTL